MTMINVVIRFTTLLIILPQHRTIKSCLYILFTQYIIHICVVYQFIHPNIYLRNDYDLHWLFLVDFIYLIKRSLLCIIAFIAAIRFTRIMLFSKDSVRILDTILLCTRPTTKDCRQAFLPFTYPVNLRVSVVSILFRFNILTF